MSNRLSKAKRTAIGASVALGSLGIGGATAALLSGGNTSAAINPPSTATPNTQGTKAQKARRYLLRHAVDATITVKTKSGYETLNLARGTIQTISPTSITVQSPDGTTLTATINSQTKFHNTTAGQLVGGKTVGVLAYEGVARAISVPKAPASSSSPTPAS